MVGHLLSGQTGGLEGRVGLGLAVGHRVAVGYRQFAPAHPGGQRGARLKVRAALSSGVQTSQERFVEAIAEINAGLQG